jgi:hypothetical protein
VPSSLRLGQSRRLVAAAAALLILGVHPAIAALPTSLAQASENVDVGILDEVDCEPSPTELEDIAAIAEQDGLSLDEAIARYGWQGCFGEVTSYLSEVYSDQYAGAAIVEDGRRAWIAFKGDIPEEAHGLVEAIPVTVELIGSRGFSETELNETLQSVYFNISNHKDVVAANGSYDQETGVITIHAEPIATLTDPDQRERLRETLQPDQPVNIAITIEVIVVDQLGGGDDESSGQWGGISPAVYATGLAVGLLVLLAARLIRDRRRV